MPSHMSRRQALTIAGTLPLVSIQAGDSRVRQSVCRWCYSKISLDRLCIEAKRIGYHSIELLNAHEVPEVKRHGLTCAVLNGGKSVTIANCLNRPENHDAVERDLRSAIDFCALRVFPT